MTFTILTIIVSAIITAYLAGIVFFRTRKKAPYERFADIVADEDKKHLDTTIEFDVGDIDENATVSRVECRPFYLERIVAGIFIVETFGFKNQVIERKTYSNVPHDNVAVLQQILEKDINAPDNFVLRCKLFNMINLYRENPELAAKLQDAEFYSYCTQVEFGDELLDVESQIPSFVDEDFCQKLLQKVKDRDSEKTDA